MKKPISYILENKRYLPPVMRDFHDQKDIFKALGRIVQRSKSRNPTDFMIQELPTWMICHIYVIDYFLWFMAKHGYTLQKSRINCEFDDIQETVSQSWKDQLEILVSANVGNLTINKADKGEAGANSEPA